MLIFSALCLLRATAPQALQIELVSGNVYKTKPPHQIAAFADGTSNALLYANRLKDKKSTSSITAIKAIIDNHYIENAYQTDEGWIVRHSENNSQDGTMFESYVFSAAATWDILRRTISATLANFMRDYKVAFPPATIVVDQLSELRKQSAEEVMEKGLNLPQVCPRFEENETGMKQALSCYASFQIARDKIEKGLEHEISEYAKSKCIKEEMVSRLNQIICIPENMQETAKHPAEKKRLMKGQPEHGELQIQECQIQDFIRDGQKITNLKRALNLLNRSSLFKNLEAEMKKIWHNLLDAKAKASDQFVFDAANGEKFKAKCLRDQSSLEDELLAYLKLNAMFFRFQQNGVWESAGITNNCMFESISQTEGAVEKLAQCFIPGEAARSKLQKTWVESWSAGGRRLRQCILGAFSMEPDVDLLAELCAKESDYNAQKIFELRSIIEKIEMCADRASERQAAEETFLIFLISCQRQITSKYQLTSEFLPLWLHDYICRKVPDLKIFCFIQPDDQKRVLVSQAEIDLKGMTDDSAVFVLNQLYRSDRAALASGLMPATAGYHYDRLQYVRTGW